MEKSNLTDADQLKIQNLKNSIFREYRQKRLLTGKASGTSKIFFEAYNQSYRIEFFLHELIHSVEIKHVVTFRFTQEEFETNYLTHYTDSYKTFLNEFIAKSNQQANLHELTRELYNQDGLTLILHFRQNKKVYNKLGKDWKNCLGTRSDHYKNNFIIEILHNGFRVAITELLPYSDLDNAFDFSRRFIGCMNGVANEPVSRTQWMRKGDNAEVFNKKLFTALPDVFTICKKLYVPIAVNNTIAFRELINRAEQNPVATSLGLNLANRLANSILGF